MTLYLDLTLSNRWLGNPVGLVRTELETLKQFLGLENVGFFIFTDNSGNLKTLTKREANQILSRFEQSIYAESSVESMQKEKRGFITRRFQEVLARVRTFINRLIALKNYLFGNYAGKATKSSEESVSEHKEFFTTIDEVRGLLASTHTCDREDCTWAVFTDRDVILTLGNAWDYLPSGKLFFEKQRHNFKTLGFIYDLVPVLFPQYAQDGYKIKFTKYINEIIWSSDHIAVISNTTKNDLQTYCLDNNMFKVPEITTITLGNKLASHGDSKPKSLAGVEGEFIIYVSTIEPRKNHDVIYRAFKRLLVQNPNKKLPTMIFVGAQGWHSQDLIRTINLDPALRDPDGKSKILLLQNIQDSELNWLYQNAIFSVFASHYEGWGLPIVESLANGTPVLTSEAPACLEASQSLGISIDADDILGWTRAMESLLSSDEILRSEKARAGKFVSPEWETFANHLADVARQLDTM